MRILKTFCFSIWVVSELFSAQISDANIGSEYGFGSRTAGLAGAGAAWGFGAFASYDNPAGLPFSGQKRLLLQVGLINTDPSFRSIDNIVVANNYTGNGLKYDSVADDYRNTFGTELGLTYRLFPDLANLTVGFTAFLPLEQIAYMDSGQTFVPEYVLYRSRTQRPQVDFGVGAEIGAGFQAGIGLHVGYTLTSSGAVFLQKNGTGASTMRLSASLKPKLAPVLSILYASSPPNPDTPPRFSAGLVFRFPLSSDNSLGLVSDANVVGLTNAAIPISFNADSSLYYDPLTVELGASFAETDDLRTYFQIEYQGWGSFKAPAISIQDPRIDCASDASACSIVFAPSRNPAFNYRNIWVPRVGQEFGLGALTLRAGYAYRPGIIDDNGNGPTGAGNYLDPSKHIFTVGAGYHFLHFLNFDIPCDVDVNLAYHALETQHVTKTPGNEAGDLTDSKIGSPGYDAGGAVYGGGLSLTLAF